MGVVYLVRHGQASFGAADYDALSERGREQSRVLGEALRARLTAVDAVFSGRMKRHRETRDLCLAALGAPALGAPAPSKELPGFDEFDHEDVLAKADPRWADRAALAAHLAEAPDPRRAFQKLFAAAVARWVSGAHDADYAESWPTFRARAVGALDAVLQELGASKTALVFTSGGPIAALAHALLKVPEAHAMDLQWTLVNAGVTKIVYGSRGTFLASLNEHGFFEGAHAALLTYR